MSSPAAANAYRLAIKAIPNASRNEVVGWLGAVLKIKVHAPALDGRANDELCQFLASVLKLPRRNVRLLQGEKSRQKLVELKGLTLADVKECLLPRVESAPVRETSQPSV